MSIKRFLARLVEKITGRKCSRCWYNIGGRCCHPDGRMFMRCWHGITRPGYEDRLAGAYRFGNDKHQEPAPGDLTEEEKYQMAQIVASLQEASSTAKDAGLLED